MADQRKIVYTATLNATEVTEELKTVAKTAESSQAAVSGGMNQLDKMTGGMVTAFKGVAGGIKASVMGMKTLKGAIAATGVGLLVIAVGSLVAWFTKTQRGAEFLEKATASLGAVFNVLTDKLSLVGETIMGVFQNPKQALIDFKDMIKKFVTDKIAAVTEMFGLLGGAISKVFKGDFKGAMKDAGAAAKVYATEVSLTGQILTKMVDVAKTTVEVLKDVAEESNAAADAAGRLADRSIQLRKDQRALSVEMSKSRADIKAYNLTAEDTTKTIEARIEAAENAMAIEKGLVDKRVALAQEELEIQRANMALSENTEEDQIRLAELEVSMNAVRMESLEMQTTLNNKLNTIRNEGKAIAEAAALAEAEALELQMTALEKYMAAVNTAEHNEVVAAKKKWQLLLDDANQFNFSRIELQELMDAEVEAINQKHLDAIDAQNDAAAKKIKDDAKALHDSKFQMAAMSIGALISLNEAFTADGEEAAKKQFNRNKALGIAMATINTYIAISDALAKDATFPGSRFIAAAAAGVTGLAQVIKIKSSQFGSTTTPSPDNITPPQSGGSASSAAQLDLGFLGQGSGTQMGRTYVISQEVTTNQQADQLVSDQAALYQ